VFELGARRARDHRRSQGSSPETPSPISCWGPTTAESGIGRGDENGRTHWLHPYAQDDRQIRNNLSLNLGLRYEFDQHMYDVDNRLSSIDLSNARFVIASGDDEAIHPSAASLLDEVPLPDDVIWDPRVGAVCP
jgi:hypothetical protein